MPLTWLDIGLIVVMLISGFLAMMRGLTREVLSIFSWAIAAIAAWFAYRNYSAEARTYIAPDILADVALIGVTFLLVLIFVSLITMKIGDRVLDSSIGALDRTFGFLFGLFRGLILVVIAYLFFSWFVEKPTQPKWIQEARSMKMIIEPTAGVIQGIAEKASEWFEQELRGGSTDQSKLGLGNENSAKFLKPDT